jgi:SAM-dependent methyltransferase
VVEQYVIRGGRAGADRLAVLARALGPGTRELLDRVGVAPGSRCLDLGCGPGLVTVELAERVGPAGRVTGVDMDPVTLEVARERATAAGLGTIDLVASNVYDWTSGPEYDLAYCRNLLQHLTRPVDVLRAMWAALRPGGVLVVEDADFSGSFCEPPNAGFDFWVDSYRQVLTANGGDWRSGRRLHQMFAAADVPAPELVVRQRLDRTEESKLMPLLTVQATRDRIVEAGIATAGEVDAALADLTAFIDDPSTLVGAPRNFQAWTRRPA